MQIRVPYGRSSIGAVVPDGWDVEVLEPPDPAVVADGDAAAAVALAEPLGGFEWSRYEGAASVAVAVNDRTRPVPHDRLLPPLMDRLESLGIRDEAITFHVAVGGHPPMRDDELDAILPATILDRYRVVSHDADAGELVHLGATARGTPVWANRSFTAAAFKIVVGTIEPHQFAGFSGGVKTAAIGLAGLATIERNHTLMADPASQIGTFADNPARQDIEEIGRMIGVDLALNVVLGRDRGIVRALAGEPKSVMLAGTEVAREACLVPVAGPVGVVVASPGGHPKDLDVYQAQKAVASAARIVRPGGTIVLAAACPLGAGSHRYEEWVATKRSTAEVIEAFRAEGFRLGPHKAYQLARDSTGVRLLVCSEMTDDLAARLLLEPRRDLQAAVDDAAADLAPSDRVVVLPHAATTIPYLVSRSAA